MLEVQQKIIAASQVLGELDEFAPLFLSSTFYKHRQVGSGGKAKRKNAQGKKIRKVSIVTQIFATSGCYLGFLV